MPLARIDSVATFYALFNLQPQGENTICILPLYSLPHARFTQPAEGARLEVGLGLVGGETDGKEADKLCSPLPIAGSPCALSPASVSAPWSRSSR
jgi:hypothetical protein